MAVPVFADNAPESGSEGPSLTELPAPSAEELAVAEISQHERAEWLSTPEAQAQREASRDAYADLSGGESKDLLVESFSGPLERLNADPARVLSQLEVEKPLGDHAALVSEGAEEEVTLLTSSVPVESDLGGEGVEPIDLALETSGSGYAPRNPLTEVELPGSAEQPIRLEGGLSVELPASYDRNAESMGEMNLFYPDTDVATDTLLAPTAGGVEVFEQIRSPESPERFSFNLDIPAGAALRSSEAGGAEIVDSAGQTIEIVPPPTATDAQGAEVPVVTTVEDRAVIVEVEHRSEDVAYPLLLDPAYINDSTSFGEWVPSLNSSYEYWLQNNGSNLAAISRGNVGGTNYYYGPDTHGQWAYGAYGQTGYIAAATFSSVSYVVHTCQTAQPHGYIGLYNPGSASYVALGSYSGGASVGTYETGWNGNSGTRAAIIGIGTGSSGVAIGCAHELFVGGYSIQEMDPEAPSVSSVGGTSSAWVKEPIVTPHVSDPGLGVKGVTLSPEGSSPHTNTQGCSGANGSRCPGTWETSFGSSYFAEGERSASVSAYDPLGPDVGSHVSGSFTFTTRVDRQKPELALEGEFTKALQEAEKEGEGVDAPELHLPVYNLKLEATDKANEGSPKTEGKARRSGVKNIKVFLDGKELSVPWSAQGCSGPEYSCPMIKTFAVPLSQVQGGGVHKLKGVAIDQVGNEREQQIEFEYFPATGIKDEYVMQHFPLPDGEGNEAEEEDPRRPELAVNVATGNVVFRQRDVEVSGPGADLEVERFYNSQLPEEESTEWGRGWTLAQTPTLELGEGEEPTPRPTEMVGTSGTLETDLMLPTKASTPEFDKELKALLTKEAGGGYEIADASGESDTALSFNGAGDVTELTTSGATTVNYDYQGGELSEIAVEDPATFGEGASVAPPIKPIFVAAFGSAGSGDGQLNGPRGVAADGKGHVWIVDRANNRVEEFSETGQYLGKFGSAGTGNGQFSEPWGITVTAAGNIWVADTGNKRLQQFNSKGEFIQKFGTKATAGSKGTEFTAPEGVVSAPGGMLWVTDSAGHRLAEFRETVSSESERFVRDATGATLSEPISVAVDASGNVFTVDQAANRVFKFSSTGTSLQTIGATGTGDGQFSAPTGVAVSPAGYIYVVDRANSRAQVFTPGGEFLTKFGSAGTGNAQFSEPRAIAFGAGGSLFVTDKGNNRVHRWAWTVVEEVPPPQTTEADEAVSVETANDLVESVEGEEAGVTTYAHSGQLLTSVDGQIGETKYAYDSAKRLTKVTLPNGTWGEIKYDAYGRAESVSVSVEGAKAKTTTFSYKAEPRRTTVTSEGEPATIYDIAPDGSVLKWWNTQVPPEIENLSGSLYANRETSGAITPGDYELLIQAFSGEGIARIQVVANGDQLVDEKTCVKTAEVSCKTVEDPWVTYTGNWSPGILQLEVTVTDTYGKAESTRFWVNIPYTPPPDPEAKEPPRFEDVLRFREEFGLDLDLKGNEIAIDERIFNLIGAWYNPLTPAGEVARATADRWGVPLRAVDAAELEYREEYMAVDGPMIDQWARSRYPSTYAGYEIDHHAGGLIRLGFTQSQNARLAEFLQEVEPLARDRFATFASVPTEPLADLEDTYAELKNMLASQPELMADVAGVEVEEAAGNLIRVESTDVGATTALLAQSFGSLAGFEIVPVGGLSELMGSRDRQGGRMLAGDRVWTDWTAASNPEFTAGTAGFGAFERKYITQEKRWLTTPYLLDAGHMGVTGLFMYREEEPEQRTSKEKREKGEKIGRIGRDAYREGAEIVDALAMRFDGSGLAPRRVFGHEPVGPPQVAWKGEQLCTNGQATGHRDCGYIVGFRLVHNGGNPNPTPSIVVKKMSVVPGDSGAPVWDPASNSSIGLVSARPGPGSIYTYVQPLSTTYYGMKREHKIVGALDAAVMGGGSLKIMQGS